MVATTGAVPVFTAVNAGILPVSLAAKPIEIVLFVHAYATVPTVAEVAKVVIGNTVATHTTWLATAVTVAVGFTVMVKLNDVPVQLTLPLV